MYSILLIEDDPSVHILIKKTLSSYRLVITDDPDQVVKILNAEKIDLIILDISLPKRDGYSVLNELQAHNAFSSIPVICLTAKNQITDKVTAFSLGADDFIEKPFHPIEFKARIDSKIIKSKKNKEVKDYLNIGSLQIDLSSHRVLEVQGGKEVGVTQTEFKILCQMAKDLGEVFSRDQLVSSLWGDEGAVFDRSIDVHVSALRKKLARHGLIFKSVPSIGYRLLLTPN